jgi:hypothetical protein
MTNLETAITGDSEFEQAMRAGLYLARIRDFFIDRHGTDSFLPGGEPYLDTPDKRYLVRPNWPGQVISAQPYDYRPINAMRLGSAAATRNHDRENPFTAHTCHVLCRPNSLVLFFLNHDVEREAGLLTESPNVHSVFWGFEVPLLDSRLIDIEYVTLPQEAVATQTTQDPDSPI